MPLGVFILQKEVTKMGGWTNKKLTETDDLTFAMSILSERCNKLNPEAPIAKKLAGTRNTLDKLRGGCPLTPGDEVREIMAKLQAKTVDLQEDVQNA